MCVQCVVHSCAHIRGWWRFTHMCVFSTLRFVVLDEMHVYRGRRHNYCFIIVISNSASTPIFCSTGVFGSHVALVIRRLRRICSLYLHFPYFPPRSYHFNRHRHRSRQHHRRLRKVRLVPGVYMLLGDHQQPPRARRGDPLCQRL